MHKIISPLYTNTAEVGQKRNADPGGEVNRQAMVSSDTHFPG